MTYSFGLKNRRRFWYICPECMDKVKAEEKQLEDNALQKYKEKEEYRHQSWMILEGKQLLKEGPKDDEADRRIFLWLKEHEGQQVLYTDSNTSLFDESVVISSPKIKTGDRCLTYKFLHSRLELPMHHDKNVEATKTSMRISYSFTSSSRREGDDTVHSRIIMFKTENHKE